LHVLGLLVCDEEEEQRNDGPRYIRHYSLTRGVALSALSVPEKSVDIILKLNKGGRSLMLKPLATFPAQHLLTFLVQGTRTPPGPRP
jgi:hypothetical protein